MKPYYLYYLNGGPYDGLYVPSDTPRERYCLPDPSQEVYTPVWYLALDELAEGINYLHWQPPVGWEYLVIGDDDVPHWIVL